MEEMNQLPKKKHPTSFWIAIVLGVLLGISLLGNLIFFVLLISDFAESFTVNLQEASQTTSRYQERFIGGEPDGSAKVLLIPVKGIILSGSADDSSFWPVQPDPVQMINEVLKKAEPDKSIKAIILEVNSPGGGITACDKIHTALKRFKEKRPEVVLFTLMDDVAASGGYYIATATERIMAHPTTLTGSIGVIASFINVEGLLKILGLKEENIKSADKKDMGSPTRPMTEAERKILQNMIDEMYQRFLDVVERGRPGLKRKEITRLADGRIYTGLQALENGLVDELGDRQDALESVKKLAKLDRARLIEYRRSRGFMDLFMMAGAGLRSSGDFTTDIKRLLLEKNTPRLMYLWTTE